MKTMPNAARCTSGSAAEPSMDVPLESVPIKTMQKMCISSRSAAKPPVELPEELLLLAFSWLSGLELLRGPCGVCRQWRRVALDPALWSQFSIVVADHASPGAVLAMLRVAPCLGYLELGVHDEPLPKGVAAAALSTNCAARQLVLHNDRTAVNTRKSILRRQVELQQLRSLTMYSAPETTVELVTAALEAPLSELEVVVCNEPGDPPLSAPPGGFPQNATALETFRYWSESEDTLAEDLMAPHLATLGFVMLNVKATTRAVQLACRCPRLRAVQLPCIPATAGLSASACPLLTELFLMIGAPPPKPKLLHFFRTASGITKLSLFCMQDPAYSFALRLLSELGSTKLEILILGLFRSCTNPSETFSLPIRIFSRFPLLGFLKLYDLPSVELMDAITPSVAPNLRILSLLQVGWDRVLCVPSNCCYPAFFRLVVRNPRLHVLGVPQHHVCAEEADIMCDCCEDGTHKIYSVSPAPHCSLYAHAEGEACGVPLHCNGRPGICPESLSINITAPKRWCDCAHEWRLVLPTSLEAK